MSEVPNNRITLTINGQEARAGKRANSSNITLKPTGKVTTDD